MIERQRKLTWLTTHWLIVDACFESSDRVTGMSNALTEDVEDENCSKQLKMVLFQWPTDKTSCGGRCGTGTLTVYVE
jgi:hypothetical protein